MKYFSILFFLCLAAGMTTACSDKKSDTGGSAFSPEEGERDTIYDLSHIRRSGELIAVTLSGPDTYYEVQGRPMGTQYALAADFARGEGVRIRMEMAHDTTEMVRMLRSGRADIIALPLSRDFIRRMKLAAPAEPKKGKKPTAADSGKAGQTLWAVRPEARELCAALERWRATPAPRTAARWEKQRSEQLTEVKRTVRAPYLSRERGVISEYDDLFRSAATTAGWDWRLVAAQCYQESGFDPEALSGAGAQGLMQIMPGTAGDYGLAKEKLTSPEDNVATAGRIINDLTQKLNDVPSPEERIKFVLAAYNCGLGHVRDAMALARKYGRNQYAWDDVAEYIRLLQDARYYRDPVVRSGYMDGEQTYNYVYSILDRYQEYGGEVAVSPRSVPAKRSGRISPQPAPGRRDI